tara:strand:+ start:1555 stop:1956 length:402 start_codon:yes stop_codon:yes gene_type:complete
LNSDHELQRVLSNPDNLLMSDALEGMIDPNLLEDPDVWDAGDFTCTLEFIGFKIRGTLQSFSLDSEQKVVSILVVPSDAIKLLTGNFLKNYRCFNVAGDSIFEEDVEEEVYLDVQFQENESALVSIIVKLANT